MTKGTNAKIKELKGIKPEKITNEQLEKLQTSVQKINRAQAEVGMLETRKHSMLHSIAGMQDELTLMQNEFEKDYGTYDININDGTINYAPENGEADKKD